MQIGLEEDKREIITAFLAELGFESFTDDSEYLLAYIQAVQFNPDAIEELKSSLSSEFVMEYSFKTIPEQNWNAVWESNYESVVIDNTVSIRAPFHEPPLNMKYDILIEPKMSFGTAHHPTTSQIISLMLDVDFNDKKVLDMGCGTSVLAILASMRNAKSVDAVDFDNWAYENSLENAERNHINNIQVFHDDAKFLNDEKADYYDIILANINRNILLNDMDRYVFSLKSKGKLLMSGFYEEDLVLIDKKAESLGLKFKEKRVFNNWCAGVWILI